MLEGSWSCKHEHLDPGIFPHELVLVEDPVDLGSPPSFRGFPDGQVDCATLRLLNPGVQQIVRVLFHAPRLMLPRKVQQVEVWVVGTGDHLDLQYSVQSIAHIKYVYS